MPLHTHSYPTCYSSLISDPSWSLFCNRLPALPPLLISNSCLSPLAPFKPRTPLPAARSNRDYILKFRQQPRQARMCGVGDKGASRLGENRWTAAMLTPVSDHLPSLLVAAGTAADRRPIDPPPVVQLTVIDKAALASSNRANQQLSARDKAAANSRSKAKENAEDHPAGQTYLQSESCSASGKSDLPHIAERSADGLICLICLDPYYLMNATLTRADDQSDLHLLKDGKTRYTLGSTVSSLFQLKDEDKSDAGFFVFPDLSVRVEGDYRLKLDLYEIVACVRGFPRPLFVNVRLTLLSFYL